MKISKVLYCILMIIILAGCAENRAVLTTSDDVKILKPRIISMETMYFMGLGMRTSTGEELLDVLWDDFKKREKEVESVKDPEKNWGLSFDFDQQADVMEFSYIACKQVLNPETVPQGMHLRELPAGKYAVFTHIGPYKSIGETYDYIYNNWIKRSGYDVELKYELELYHKLKFGKSKTHVDIYIPIK
ncbi:MAG: GyrI-like domain-containing protein [Candidatus Cloacimonetes bacterium]|nr:GyrI-like domain-containing protein [Candidatus Cloacimonadota bacterium]